MNLTTRTAFRLKNFRQHMRISDNLSLAGLLRRWARRHPRAAACARGTTVLGGVYFLMMGLLPGSQLPLQGEVKLSLLAFSRLLAQAWHYNAFSPEPQQYLIRLNEIALAALDAQLFEPCFLCGLLGEVRAVAEEERGAMTREALLDLLIYSEVILQSIIRYEKRLLLEKELQDYYEWVFATVFAGLEGSCLTEKERKHLRLVYPLVQYLLNFADAEGRARCVHVYHQFAARGDLLGESREGFRWKVMAAGLSEGPFKASLKQIYAETSSPELQREILGIFERLNLVYQHQHSS